MKAMIFAAGLGSRLRPLTDKIPKALVKVNSVPLLEIQINKLIHYGFNQIIINVHHFSETIKTFINSKKFEAEIVISDETDELLDTGGGLLKASWFFSNGKPFLVCNSDIMSNINLHDFYKKHNDRDYIASLAVRDRITSRYFLFNDEDILCGWENIKTSERLITKEFSPLKNLAFSGIQILNPEIFDLIKQKGKFSITKAYIELSRENTIHGYRHDNDDWYDLGNIENLISANEYYKSRPLF
jgi:NDP-sugar pyrophosphorylase family protein